MILFRLLVTFSLVLGQNAYSMQKKEIIIVGSGNKEYDDRIVTSMKSYLQQKVKGAPELQLVEPEPLAWNDERLYSVHSLPYLALNAYNSEARSEVAAVITAEELRQKHKKDNNKLIMSLTAADGPYDIRELLLQMAGPGNSS